MARKLLIAVLTLLGLVLVGELGMRVLERRLGETQRIRDYRAFLVHGTLRTFQPRAHTVFQRHPGTPFHNSHGYSDREWSVAKTPGVPRILCLGGSTTESGNAKGLEGSYPYLLERTLEERTGRDFEVLNAGISGWTSAEILIAWFLTLQDFAPDLVLYHEAVNDVAPRFRADFRADYSHWRRSVPGTTAGFWERFLASWSDIYLHFRLQRGGIPDILTLTSNPERSQEPLLKVGRLPEETALPFRRNVRNIAESARAQGAEVVLMTLPMKPGHEGPGAKLWAYGASQHNRHMRELAAEQGYLLVDAALGFEARGGLAAEFSDGVHLSPQGNQLKADLIADALLERWIPGLPAESAQEPQR